MAKKTNRHADKTISHQIQLRGQFTRIAKQAIAHLSTLKGLIKAELDEASTAKNWSAAAKLRKTLYNLDKLVEAQYAVMSDELIAELADLFYYQSEWTSKLLGADVGYSVLTENAVRGLIESDPFDGKILSEWIAEQRLGTQTKIKQAVRVGVMNGLPAKDIVDALINDPVSPFVGTRRNAEILVRTAAAHVSSQADIRSFKQAGYESYQLSAVLDTRTTKLCGALDGKVYKLSDPGRKVPPFHPGCRTTMIAIFDGDEPFGDTYETWLGKQSEASQRKVLGAARYKMWKAGAPLESFVDLDSDHVIPLSDLKSSESFA
ncbi:minor capsid protein [Pseudomonas putida]|uniref:minor capsid protein n=1 Tax=Pseudomonas putida TaxID=303 RepID=UPI002363A175|nr:minor capsid protein [Pseudomonas putida]MDD2038740.1 minor capsid protein [Pseudomonas putida]MDD2044315.1 minor capsid protein [Pseudomonas putida]